MMVDDGDREIRPRNDAITPNMRSARSNLLSDEPSDDSQNNPNIQDVTARQSRRTAKAVPADNQTALRNTELAQINNEYVQNMAAILKQKLQNKIPAQAKKNAAFWVFGVGIGSVGAGLGASLVEHPLHVFSGDELYVSLYPETKKQKKAKKRARGLDDEESGSDGRRVRARGEGEEQIGRGNHQQMHDVRIPFFSKMVTITDIY